MLGGAGGAVGTWGCGVGEGAIGIWPGEMRSQPVSAHVAQNGGAGNPLRPS
eukprot:COSAG02_NODE_36072_length_459_cov_1.150000_1_plen_50_part_10